MPSTIAQLSRCGYTPWVGDHTVAEAVHAFAQHCDVVTFDHEHVPAEVLYLLVAEGVELHPRPTALRFAQDKLAMRERLTELGVPCPRWARVDSAADVTAFADAVGWPVVAKTPRGGYDGKGVRVAASAEPPPFAKPSERASLATPMRRPASAAANMTAKRARTKSIPSSTKLTFDLRTAAPAGPAAARGIAAPTP